MKKRVLSIALVVAMIAIIAAGSFAYFTDKDEATNTFTVGNVKIDLIESSLHRTNAGNNNPQSQLWSDLPMEGGDHYTDAQIKDNAKEYTCTDVKVAPGQSYHKMPYVVNTGVNDAYVRIRVLIPAAMNDPDIIAPQTMYTSSAISGNKPEFTFGYDAKVTVNVDGKDYVPYVFTRVEPLKASEMTYWNVWGTVGLSSKVTNEVVDELVEAGAIVDGTFNVLVQADAIQAEGFDNATKAFDAFDAQK